MNTSHTLDRVRAGSCHLVGKQTPLPGRCLHEMFELQARRLPDATAVAHDGGYVSYRHLNARANRFARYFRRRGIQDGDLIAVYCQPSIDCIAALLAIHKAGAAFVPIAPAYASARVDQIISAAPIALAVVDRGLEQALGRHVVETVALQQLHRLAADEVGDDLQRGPLVAHLAYVIYTSGSSGTPKGVMVHHLGIANLVTAMAERWPIDRDSRVLQFASLAFDASIPEWAGPLIRGATVVLKPGNEPVLGQELVDFIESRSVTLFKMPAASLRALPRAPMVAVRTVVTAGDACNEELATHWSKGRRLFNCYGPTEVSIGTTMADLSALRGEVTIGAPNPNIVTDVLDSQLRPVEVNQVGELFVSGPGLSWGYLGQPGLTAEKFVPNCHAGSGERMYRTGDLVSCSSDGALRFLGRVDEQVKIRGFRVELGEVEAALLAHPVLSQAAVVAVLDARRDYFLLAYLKLNEPLLLVELREFLATRLPPYMMPAQFRRLDAFPLTTNGKVDKQLLATQQMGVALADESPMAACSDLEVALMGLWEDALGCDITVDQSLLHLGGDSLIAAKLTDALNVQYKANLQVPQLLGMDGGVRELACYIERKAKGGNFVPHATNTPEEIDLDSLSEQELDQLLARLEREEQNFEPGI